MNTELRFVLANGLRFAYFEEGEGPLALLFHGFPDTAHTWDDVRSKIAAKGYRVVTPFMRGYHPTEIPKADTDAKTIAEDALALIKALGENSAVLIGHDWGAMAVYGAAAMDASRVSKMIAIAIPHPATLRPSPRKLWAIRHFLSYRSRNAPKRFAAHDFAELRSIYARWSPQWKPDDSEFARVRECFSDSASLDAAFGYYRALSVRVPSYLKTRITVPTVVFSGRSDSVTTKSDYTHAKKMFASDYVIEELDGGHFLHREEPARFAERLLAHL